MRFRKVISVFLLLVLSAQLLPLKQTISWLLGGQATEELAHAGESDSGTPGDGLQKEFLPVVTPTLFPFDQSPSTVLHPVAKESLPSRHADDILTPPPNC